MRQQVIEFIQQHRFFSLAWLENQTDLTLLNIYHDTRNEHNS